MANQKLPGFHIIYRDGNLVPPIQQPTTERLLIIGNALDGPVNSPQLIRSFSEAEELFGPLIYKNYYKNPNTGTADNAYADNNLLKGLHEALHGGAGDVLLCRVGGTHATGNSTLSASLTVSSIYPGRIYNGVTVVSASGASTHTITVTQPTNKGGTQVWTFNNSDTLGYMVSTINNDSRNSSVTFMVPVSVANNAITTLGVGTITLSGATNGTAAPGEDYYSSKADLYTALTQSNGTFDALLGTEFDVAVLVCVYADDQVDETTTTSVAQEFAEFLHNVHKETRPCHGVLGVRPNGKRTASDLATYADAALLSTTNGLYDANNRWLKFGYFMYSGFYYLDPDTNVNEDIGRHLSIVAGPDLLVTHRDVGYYNETGHAVYAGMITNLPAHRATTNKPIGQIKNIMGSYPKATHELLNQGVGRDQTTRVAGGGAYVTFKFNTTIGRPIVVSDNTASQRGSDWQTLHTFRIANLATRMAQQVLYPFIGESNSLEAQSAMKTQLKTALNKLVDMGALLGGEGTGYQFTIVADPVDLLLGAITVTLFLRPALEIKTIKVVVNVGQ